MILRPYQQIALDQIRTAFSWRHRAVLLVMPTGSGKTVLFSEVTRGAIERGNSVLILAHRTELVDQISTALREFHVPHGFIAAGYPEKRTAPVQVASVQTLVRRVTDVAEPRLIICDEAHHTVTGNTWGKVLSRWPNARILGVTATPIRLDGHGLGNTFDWMVQGPTTQELIDAGYLAPLRIFAPPTVNTQELHRRFGEFIRGEVAALMDKPTITGDCIEHYRKHACSDGEQRPRRALVFCVSVEHAKSVAQAFRTAGFAAESIDGTLDRHFRRDCIERFKDGRLTVLTSCDLVSEGFDLPAIECGISLRPTSSVGLWLQQVGRCLRTAPGKTHALILDHAGNSLRHGLPTDDREWTLDKGLMKAGKPRESHGVRVCPQCFAANPLRVRGCSECSYVWTVQSREVEKREGELTEMTPEEWRARRARMTQGQTQTLADLVALGRMRGYKSPERWAEYVIKGREAKRRVGT